MASASSTNKSATYRRAAAAAFLCVALLCLVSQPASAWIMDSQVVEYSPDRKSYLAYISVWYMNSAEITEGMVVYQIPQAVWGIPYYTGDTLGTDYAGGIPIRQTFSSTPWAELRITGSGTVRQYNAILMNVYFLTSNRVQNWRIFYWNLGNVQYFWRWSYRWYQYRTVSNPAVPRPVLPADARLPCQRCTLLGQLVPVLLQQREEELAVGW